MGAGAGAALRGVRGVAAVNLAATPGMALRTPRRASPAPSQVARPRPRQTLSVKSFFPLPRLASLRVVIVSISSVTLDEIIVFGSFSVGMFCMRFGAFGVASMITRIMFRGGKNDPPKHNASLSDANTPEITSPPPGIGVVFSVGVVISFQSTVLCFVGVFFFWIE